MGDGEAETTERTMVEEKTFTAKTEPGRVARVRGNMTMDGNKMITDAQSAFLPYDDKIVRDPWPAHVKLRKIEWMSQQERTYIESAFPWTRYVMQTKGGYSCFESASDYWVAYNLVMIEGQL